MVASRARSIAPLLGAVLLVGCGGSDSDDLSASAADWCSFAADAEVVDETFDSLGNDPGSIEDGLKQVRSIAEELPRRAPAEIKSQAEVLSDGALQIVDAFEEADFNLLDADLSFLDDQALSDRMDAANAEIDEYTQRECGRNFGGDDTANDPAGDDPAGDDPAGDDPAGDDPADDGGFDPSAGTLREQLIVQFESIGLTNAEATCIADNLDFNDPAVQSGDVAAMLDVFGQCNISLDRLGELGGG